MIAIIVLVSVAVTLAVVATLTIVFAGRRVGVGVGGRRDGAREQLEVADPADALRAEQRARSALREIVSAEEWAMYEELGFLRVWGSDSQGPAQGGTRVTRAGAPYAFLIYPHRPVVSYLPQTRTLLGELTVRGRLADGERERAAAAADVLATWIELTGCEQEAIGNADFHLPGRDCDPDSVRRDLWRLEQWEQQQLRRAWRERVRPPAS